MVLTRVKWTRRASRPTSDSASGKREEGEVVWEGVNCTHAVQALYKSFGSDY